MPQTSEPAAVARLEAAGIRAVSFDLFGTLVTVEKPPDPGAAVAEALCERGVDLPAHWESAYRTSYIETQPLEEVPLQDHVRALFETHAEDPAAVPDRDLIDDALQAAFDTPLQTREGAVKVVETLSGQMPVGILSNSSVAGLVDRTVERSDLSTDTFDGVNSSVGIGWRKPHERAFEHMANDLGADMATLLHVGDDPRTDGGASRVGATAAIIPETGPISLEAIVGEL